MNHAIIHINTFRPSQIAAYSLSLLLITFLTCSLSLLTLFLINRPLSPSPTGLRHLNQNKPSMKNIYDYEYSFLNNITMLDYIGNWKEMQLGNQSAFATNEGVAEMIFTKIKNKHYVFSLDTNNSLNVIFFLKEDKYVDNTFKGNFSLSFSDGFLEDLRAVSQANASLNELVISNNDTSLDLNEYRLFSSTKHHINSTNITLTFRRESKYLKDSFSLLVINPFAFANLSIRGDFSVDIQAEVEFSRELEVKVRNYSFILTLLLFIDIYFIFNLLVEVIENNQIGMNLDLFTIISSILYKSFICTAHLYLSLTTNNEELSYEYGIPSIVSFLSFSLFELRLLLYAWKARYTDIIFTNPNLFRRKLFVFYSLFYVVLFLSLISIKSIFSYFWSSFLFFSFTWLFQIIHCVRKGTRPPISIKHIVFTTLSKLFLPIYLKAYDGNSFELRPSYLKVAAIVTVVLVQMCVVVIQKVFGAKVIVPKCWRTLPYNYFRDRVNVEEHISQNPDCAICLDSLKETVDEEAHNEKNGEKVKTKGVTAIKVYIEKIKKDIKDKAASRQPHLKYMVTPCDHIYHSVCLEKWMALKNECPYCKRTLPPLE